MTNEKLTSTAAVLLLALSASLTTIGAFSPTPLNRLTNQRSLIVKYDVPSSSSSSSSVVSPLGLQRRIVYEKESNQTGLFMSEDDDDGEANEIDNDGEETASTEQSSSDVEADAAAQISSYKSSLNPRRSFSSSSSSRPGSSAITPLDVTMKFGGSSLANSERVDRVAHLIQDRIRPPPNEDGTPSDEIPVRPRAVICSAMGKTTNSLLSAGEMALEGRVDVEALRTLHLGTCRDFDLPERTREDVEKLLDECEDMLNGVRLIQELSPKSLDQLVSYGERCSVRIMAARLNQIGVPAQAFDAWDVGVVTDDNYGDAKLLPSCIESIRDRFSSRIDPNVVAVVTGFIGE